MLILGSELARVLILDSGSSAGGGGASLVGSSSGFSSDGGLGGLFCSLCSRLFFWYFLRLAPGILEGWLVLRAAWMVGGPDGSDGRGKLMQMEKGVWLLKASSKQET